MLIDRTEAERLVAEWDDYAWQQANHYHRLTGYRGDAEDYHAAATLGLWVGATRYDPGTGNEFSTFALHWVKHFVRRHAMRERSQGLGGGLGKYLETTVVPFSVLDGKDRRRPFTLPAPRPDESSLAAAEADEFWRRATAGLTRLEGVVVRLYYRRRLSDQQVAEVAGVSRARVQQLRESALRRIRASGSLAAYAGEGVPCPA